MQKVLFYSISLFVTAHIVIRCIRQFIRKHQDRRTIAFFHPFCNIHGGGEKMLWCLVKTFLDSLQISSEQRSSPINIVVYNSNYVKNKVDRNSNNYSIFNPHEVLDSCKKYFEIDLFPYYCTDTLSVDNKKNPNISSLEQMISNPASIESDPIQERNRDRASIKIKSFISSHSSPKVNSEIKHNKSLDTSMLSQNKFSINQNPESKNCSHFMFIPLSFAWILSSKLYACRFLQIVYETVVGVEAILRFCPAVFFETCNNPFSILAARILSPAWCIMYIHYPTINPASYSSIKASNFTLYYLRKLHFIVCLVLYSFFINFIPHEIIVNSTYTYLHLQQLREHWHQVNRLIGWVPKPIMLIYPPCNIDGFHSARVHLKQRANRVISIAQFRPEKKHWFQIELFHQFIQLLEKKKLPLPDDLQLLLCGTIRGQKDAELVSELKDKTLRLLGENSCRVVFKINPTSDELQKLAGCSKVGLHTMVDEHFGISVAELLASGVLVVAHDSGGPRYDILNDSEFVSNYRGQGIVVTKCQLLHEGKETNLTNSTAAPLTSSAPLLEHQLPKQYDNMIEKENTKESRTENLLNLQSDSEHLISLPQKPSSTTPSLEQTWNPTASRIKLAKYGLLCTDQHSFAEALFISLYEPPLHILQQAEESLSKFPQNNDFGLRIMYSTDVLQKLC